MGYTTVHHRPLHWKSDVATGHDAVRHAALHVRTAPPLMKTTKVLSLDPCAQGTSHGYERGQACWVLSLYKSDFGCLEQEAWRTVHTCWASVRFLGNWLTRSRILANWQPALWQSCRTHRIAGCLVARVRTCASRVCEYSRPALTADERMPATSVRPFTNELWMAQETTGSRALTLHPIVHADTLRVPINSSAL